MAYILFTDIYRSSHLWESFPTEYRPALERHNATVECAVEAHDGSVLKGLGDGYIALFDRAADCAACAIELQAGLSASQVFPDGTELLLRVICHGGVLQRLAGAEGDYFGNPLNRAARICQVCNPGQLLVSRFVVESWRPDPARLRELGLHRLRDLTEPEYLYQVDDERFAHRDFPPPVSLSSRPNNLTIQPSTFIGRQREVSELRALLAHSDARGAARLVTVTASGGYGKSRLAAQVCADLLDEFKHGVFEVLLAPVSSPERFEAAVAEALGLRLQAGRALREQLVDHLRDRHILLHLDNFEHLTEAAPAVAELLAQAPQLRVLVTSRQPLRLKGEQVYALDPLEQGADPTSAAVQLFADRASMVRHDFELDRENLPLVAAICARLDGVPLAIELSAAWIDVLSLDELLEQVGAQLELTARMTDVDARHHSVRASLDWSWSQLTEEQRAFLRRVATFRGGFLPSAAEELAAGLEGPPLRGFALRARLAELSDKSWLYSREVGGQTRFFVRDAAAREYAQEHLLASADYEPAVLAHSRCYSGLLAQHGPRLATREQLPALGVLGAELENIFEGLSRALKLGQLGHAEAVALLLPYAEFLGRYLQRAARFDDQRVWYERLRAVADQLGDPRLRFHALAGMGHSLWDDGRHVEAETAIRAAHALALKLGEPLYVANALNDLGGVLLALARLDEAEAVWQESLALRRAAGDSAREPISLLNLARLRLYGGQLADAAPLLEQSLAGAQAQGLDWLAALVLTSQAWLAGEQQRFDEAMALYERSIEIDTRLGNDYGVCDKLTKMSYIERARRNYDEALALADRARELARDRGFRELAAIARAYSGMALEESGQHAEAATVLLEAIAELTASGDRWCLAQALCSSSVVAARRRKFEEAHLMMQRSAVLAVELEAGVLLLQNLLACAEILEAQGDRAAASLLVSRALATEEAAAYPFNLPERELLARLSDCAPATEASSLQEQLEQAVERLRASSAAV